MTLTEAQADALAEMCKRIGYDDVRRLSGDEDECREMTLGLMALGRELANQGFAPR